MSVKASSAVWEHSKAKGGALLVLLALADRANDQFWCYPGIEDLSRKSKLTTRQVVRIIQELEDLGDLMVERNRGPRGTNRYLLMCGTRGKITEYVTPDKMSPLTKCQGDISGSQMSPEPSGTVTHTKKPGGYEESETLAEFPSLEEVLKVAAEYPGNMHKGTPAVIPPIWAENYFYFRTFEKREWPVQWQKAMVFKFEIEWTNGQPAARGRGASGAATGFAKKTARARGEILQEMAQKRAAGEDVGELQKELQGA